MIKHLDRTIREAEKNVPDASLRGTTASEYSTAVFHGNPARQHIPNQLVVVYEKLMAEPQNIPTVRADLGEALKHARHPLPNPL